MAGIKFKEGDYIELADSGAFPFHEYVKGHVTADEFAKAYQKATAVQVKPDFPVKHVYGRWAQTAFSRGMGWAAQLETYGEPGRGRFRMTEVKFRDLQRQ